MKKIKCYYRRKEGKLIYIKFKFLFLWLLISTTLLKAQDDPKHNVDSVLKEWGLTKEYIADVFNGDTIVINFRLLTLNQKTDPCLKRLSFPIAYQ